MNIQGYIHVDCCKLGQMTMCSTPMQEIFGLNCSAVYKKLIYVKIVIEILNSRIFIYILEILFKNKYTNIITKYTINNFINYI